MIFFAYFFGSDYSIGIESIGPVKASEIIKNVHSFNKLEEYSITSPDVYNYYWNSKLETQNYKIKSSPINIASLVISSHIYERSCILGNGDYSLV